MCRRIATHHLRVCGTLPSLRAHLDGCIQTERESPPVVPATGSAEGLSRGADSQTRRPRSDLSLDLALRGSGGVTLKSIGRTVFNALRQWLNCQIYLSVQKG
jgi:hypothetical protein